MGIKLLTSQNLIFLLYGLAGTGDALASQSFSVEATKKLIEAGTAVVRESMKDPDAAKFRNVALYISSFDQPRICGQVNGKNSYGAYTGFGDFFLDPANGEVTFETDTHDPETWAMIVESNCRTRAESSK